MGSIGSVGSFLSIGSAGSALSALSFASRGSVLSARSADSLRGLPMTEEQRRALAAGLVAVAALLVFRRLRTP